MPHQALADGVARMEDVDGHVPGLGVGDAGPEELPELVHAGLDVDVVVVLLHRLTIPSDLTRASGPTAWRPTARAGERGPVAVQVGLLRERLPPRRAEAGRQVAEGTTATGTTSGGRSKRGRPARRRPRTGNVVSVDPSPRAWAASNRFCTAGKTDAAMASA